MLEAERVSQFMGRDRGGHRDVVRVVAAGSPVPPRRPFTSMAAVVVRFKLPRSISSASPPASPLEGVLLMYSVSNGPLIGAWSVNVTNGNAA